MSLLNQTSLLKHAFIAGVQDREHVVLPRRPDQSSPELLARLSIAKVMEFTSQSLRSVWTAAVCVAAMLSSFANLHDVMVI